MNTVRLVIVNGGVSDPSSTRLLTDRIAQKSIDALTAGGGTVEVGTIDLGALAVDIARSLVSGFPTGPVQSAIERLAGADAIIVGSPIYKAGLSGLFKSFIDLIDNDLLLAKPVILAATGGSARHAMVVDDHMRPLFAFLRTIPMPTSLYAAPEDWGSADLGHRITRAATELAAVIRSGAPTEIAAENWSRHEHQFAGNATRADQTVGDLDFTSDLMRLAAGGAGTLGGEAPNA